MEIGGWEEDVPEDLREMLGQMERVVSLRGKLVGDMTDAEKADFDAYMEFVKGAGISELRGFLEGRKGEFIAEPAPADSTGTGGRRHRKRRTVRRRHRVARRTQTKNKKSH